ncbi:imidazole glycerol phosphate synthase subunit HisH [Stygiolobus caldivivus]|uniref:Imidazole glycerol phosphate synthase subunit HisH n=1 Tax=Stygiolobus caldivivus TaxID=2824673 RepID=A0A8D5U7U4_9CREN|nr:imidazole glycerol phosphate synthase subunit HisH [Stygiolobus caldivivus]BCU71365.1 imidazole glycerol phosphate synthase subunit HisH [Stygiolobus caldivivus]
MRATVINYGVGNLFSISSGLKRVGFEVSVNSEPFGNEDLVVLPGVGSFSAVSGYLGSRREVFEDMRKSGVYFLGVCLGMQVMFEEGTEGGISKGLGWFKGKVDKLIQNNKERLKLPHIGWEKLVVTDLTCPLTEGLNNQYVYYVHSYVAYPDDESIVRAVSVYGISYPAIVCSGNLIGTQFHPEKSSKVGKVFLGNLYRWVKK